MTRISSLAQVVLGISFVALFASAGTPERLESRALRGYGRAWAELAADDTVAIHAESPEKAALWAARYLHVNAARVAKPGVVRLPDGTYTQVSLEGDTVRIRHSADEPTPGVAADVLPAIPMYLNSWDDFAFRFYYWPGRSPREMTGQGPDWGEYDPRPEFDFAKRNADSGFIFWCDSHPNSYAKGLMDNPLWDWSYRLAKDRHLPIVLNTNFSVPYWLVDAFREENEQHAPQFAGSYHSVGEPGHAGAFLSWASEKARRIGLASWRDLVRQYNADEVIELLEPHGELNHGDYTVFIEHGPLADASFRAFLRETYQSPAAVARRWHDDSIRAWDDCTLPEIAEFAGWGPGAIDLAGDWRGHPLPAEDGSEYPAEDTAMRHQKKAARPPAEWLAPDFDDSAWPLLYRGMPGSDLSFNHGKRPAVLRRHFQLPAQPAGTRTWLCLWDLSSATGNRVGAYVNGRLVGEDGVRHAVSHWMACEVTEQLRDGDNVIALDLPHGVVNYRVYLTHDEPRAYPYFGPGLNAKWVDFCLWQEWSRLRAVETGIAALREAEPDKSIVAMAPGAYFDSMRALAPRFGTRFHDTGLMSVCYWEALPMLMRSADLPFSLEPGGPAGSLQEFQRFVNLWLRAGVNAVHYFIHIGSIFWKDDIRAEFERVLPALKMMGRMHLAEPDIAFVMDSRIDSLMGFPWRNDPNAAFPSGYSDWRLNETLKDRFQIDAVTPADIAPALAARYRFLIDCNNTVMTPAMAGAIEAYVRAGGTYVAMFQTGRHTPEEPDRWVLRPLAGCRVASLTRYRNEYHDWGASIEPERRVRVRRAVGERWPDDASAASLPWEFDADGAFLEPEAGDAEVLYRWCDGPGGEPGSAAVVSRRVGEGRIVTFGVRARFYDVEARLLDEVLLGLGAEPVPLVAPANVHARHYRTNDGLQDVWLLANEKWDADTPYEFRFRDGAERALTDVLTGAPAARSGTLGPNGFVLATSPRGAAEQARGAWDWVRNQFGWWQGAERPAETLPPTPKHDDVIDIGAGDWAFRFADGTERSAPLSRLVAGRDIPEGVTAYTCEREIEIPADWTDSDIELWAVGQYAHTFCPARFWVYLDGKEIHFSDGGVKGRVLDLKPGDRATLQIKVEDDRHPALRGFGGACFLYRRPHPAGTFPLDGEWEAFRRTTDPEPHRVTLPGRYEQAVALRRVFDLPAEFAGRRTSIDFTSRGDFLHGVIVNGHYLRRHHHRHGDRTVLDITPWLRPGERNELWLVGNYFADWARQGDVTDVKLVW